ncbi:Oxidoreductase, short-chain dehydrogenase/reductase family [hydrothermal vent metagenome]|uniref:Oxidoreductase, short-chain dehydrogenase/reductase family n=1 Tax=hydrothermal vent metagenome TaxID=652676 RepID=A0A3B0SYU7_9ZZZZ
MFQDKVVWITGASAGIGEAVAYEMAHAGAKLVLSARREDELLRVAGNIGTDDILILPFDITDETVMAEMVERVMGHYGRIDLLLNNAGISQRACCVDTDMATYRKVFEVDVFGQIALTKQVLPIMIAQKSGHIAVTSSVAGKIGVATRTAYCAVKHAMMGFFDALRCEVRDHNIAISCITPGFIRTDISRNALTGDGGRYGIMDDDIKSGMEVTKAAKIIVGGLGKGKKEIVVSQLPERAALLIKRFFPNLLFWIMAKKA